MAKSSLVTLLALTSLAAAQCPPSNGPFVGIPAMVSLDAQTTVFNGDGSVLGYKHHGFTNSQPRLWTPRAAGEPDFNLRSMMFACGVTTRTLPDVDAMSLGVDWILANSSTGAVEVPPNRWGALTFSVSRQTRGRPGSTVEREANAGSPASDVFTYFLPGSDMPPELVDVGQRALDSSEIGLGTAVEENVDAIDHYIPIYLGEARVRSLVPSTPTVYFSVSNASLPVTPTSWFGGTPPSGATILQTRWSRIGWSCPRVHKTFRDLGLQQSDDIDALAIDALRDTMLFSTTDLSLDPILFIDCSTDRPTAVPYTDPMGTPVSTNAGLLNSDDVDAICALDPSTRGAAGAPANNSAFYWIGTALPTALFPPTPELSASGFRLSNQGQDSFRTFVNGWPSTGAGPGFAALLVQWNNNPWIPLPLFNRNPMPIWCGDLLQVTFPVFPIMQNNDVTFRWFVTDGPTITTIAEAHPITVHL